MKRLTLNQYRVLLSAGKPTTRIKAARQLERRGVIEITKESRGFFSRRVTSVEFRLTEYGLKVKEMAPFMRRRAR